jgi:hypothetical protein
VAGKRQKPRNTLQGHRKVPGLIALPSRTQEKRWSRAELEAMNRDTLRQLAGAAGLAKHGLKTNLVDRLLAAGDDLASADQPGLPVVEWPAGKGWHAQSIVLWAEIWRSEVSQIWDKHGEMGRLLRYILNFDAWLKLTESLAGREVVRGSRGQARANPLFNVRSGLELELKAAEEKLGLTPMDRMRLGIEIGGAAAGLDSARKILEEQGMGMDEFGEPPAGWEISG